jgi:hypothetical protein
LKAYHKQKEKTSIIMRCPKTVGLLLAALAGKSAADNLAAYTVCYDLFGCPQNDGAFITDFGAYRVDAGDGCHATDVPGMVEFCVDWGQARAHFRFSHQSDKRCLRVTAVLDLDNDWCPTNSFCKYILFEEVGCNWRQEPVKPEASVSGVAAPVATTAPGRNITSIVIPPGATHLGASGARTNSSARANSTTTKR